MIERLLRVARWSAVLVLVSGVLAWAQILPREPSHTAGTSVTGAFEGWFANHDGTFSLLLGYNNRNEKQELDIPIGPNNHIDPGGPDRGQPTHFQTGRQWGMFVVRVPKDFGKNKIAWTIVANGQTTVIPASLHPDYEVSPFVSTASVIGSPEEGDTPPVLRFDEKGPSVQGPLALSVERTATMSSPLPLQVWVADDGKVFTNSGALPGTFRARSPVTLKWTKYRGPGTVTFAKDRPEIRKTPCEEKGMAFCGTASTTVTFGAPGDYVLHLVANDYSGEGGGGFQCCWTTGQVKIAVTP